MTFREWLLSEKTKLSATGIKAGGRASNTGMYKPSGPYNPLGSKKTKPFSL